MRQRVGVVGKGLADEVSQTFDTCCGTLTGTLPAKLTATPFTDWTKSSYFARSHAVLASMRQP